MAEAHTNPRRKATHPESTKTQTPDGAQVAGPPSVNQESDAEKSKLGGSNKQSIRDPGKLADSLAIEALSWSGTFYIVRSEERVRTKANEVKQRLMEYRQAFLELQNLEGSMNQAGAAAANLTRQTEALSQEESRLRGELQNLKQHEFRIRQTRDSMAASRMTFYADGDGNHLSLEGLNQQLAELNRQIDRSLDVRLPRPEITSVAFMAIGLTERVYWSSFKATFRAFPWIFASAA